MRKLLVPGIVSAIIVASFSFMTGAFAVDIGSQSVDVIVGEVDRINTDEEQEDIDAPQTGIFGLNYDSDFMVISTAFTIPATVFFVFLTRFCYLRIKRNRSIRQSKSH